MEYFTRIGERRFEVRPTAGGAEVDGTPIPVDLAPAGDGPVRSVRIGGRSFRLLARRNGTGRWTLDLEGRRSDATVHDRGQEAVLRARKAAGAGSGLAPLRAPMPGLVVRVEVAAGDPVAAGQGIVIVEAMKMENELKAPAAARVRAVFVEAGTTVEKDQLLVEFEALEAEAGDPEAEGGRG
jgi:biotin carboxyl carrier protein